VLRKARSPSKPSAFRKSHKYRCWRLWCYLELATPAGFTQDSRMPRVQTSYSNWWDAEEPRKWLVASDPSTALRVNEWREKEPGSRPGRDEFRPATTKERGKSRSSAKKQPRGIEDQKSGHEKIKIRTLEPYAATPGRNDRRLTE
jgi:hypothetical protein